MTFAPNDVPLRTARLTALFCSLAAALYGASQIEPSPVVGLFLSAGPLIAVILWLQKDARRSGVGAVQDWGLFLWFAWPIVIPWYACKTRTASLYPTLYRLEGRGLIEGRWVERAGQRRRRYYRLTRVGRTALAKQRSTWDTFFMALNRVARIRHA
jgi:PadR family transcriptional regulator